MTAPATTWHDAMKRAAKLNPDRIAAEIVATSDTGLRATRYDAMAGRTTSVACDDKHCHEGDPELHPHSHMVVSDPTGNAAVRGHRNRDTSIRDHVGLELARIQFVGYASAVIRRVSSQQPGPTWQSVLSANKAMPKGTVEAGIDLDHQRRLPDAITKVEDAVDKAERIAKVYLPRDPSQDEKHWDNREYNDNDVCAWHLEIHRRYRRPRIAGTNICATCTHLATLLGCKPPRWLLEAEVDREGKPRAWQQALGRCMDELGVTRESA